MVFKASFSIGIPIKMLFGYSSGTFDVTMVSNGYRYVRFKICDKASNCVYSELFFRIDRSKPSVSFQLLNGSTIMGSSYYSSTYVSGLDSFTFTPTLRWTAVDTISGVNPSDITMLLVYLKKEYNNE